MTELPIDLANRLQSIDVCESTKFSELVEAISLDPSKDFIGADLSGLSLANDDLSGFNFSDSDLRRTSLHLATRVNGMVVSSRTKLDPVDERWIAKRIKKGVVRSQDYVAPKLPKRRYFGFEFDIHSAKATAYISEMLEDITASESIYAKQGFNAQGAKKIAAKFVKLGLYYQLSGEYNLATTSYHRAEQIYKDVKKFTKYELRSEIGSVYHLLALCYLKLRILEEAKLHIEASLRFNTGGVIHGTIEQIRRDTLQDITDAQR